MGNKIALNYFTGEFDFVRKNTKDQLISLYRDCNVYEDTWLYNQQTPSNLAGFPLKLSRPSIIEICVQNNKTTQFDVEIYEHDGNLLNLTLLDTLNVSTNNDSFPVSLSSTKGKQIAARVVNVVGDRPMNLNVEILVEGD